MIRNIIHVSVIHGLFDRRRGDLDDRQYYMVWNCQRGG